MNRVFQYLRSAVLRQDGMGLTDAHLMECFVDRRDEGAAEGLLRRHGPMVLGVCRRILHNECDVEDAFQATFLVLVRKAASIRPREMVGNWLYGVARQTALRAKVAAAKRGTREKQVRKMPEPKAEGGNLWSDLVPVLDQELSRLPDKYRSAIVLCDLEGKSYKEAAQRLGCPIGTLSARLARGRTMLAKRLTRVGMAVSSGTLAGLLSEKGALASMPPALVASTIKAVNLSAAGQATAVGVVSAKVAALTQGVLKTMLLTKLKIATGLVLLATLAITSAGLSLIPSDAKQPSGGAKTDHKAPIKTSVEKATHLVKVPSRLAGIVLFIGTEIREGEKLPPEAVITVQVGGETKTYRCLKKGDAVKEGQLLARLDDRLARAQLAAKKSKVVSSKADADGAKSIADEVESKLKTAEDLYQRRAIVLEEYRSAKLTRDKMFFDALAKVEAAKLPELELAQAQRLIDMHEIRSSVNGIIAVIEKRPGEAAKKLETVFEIEVMDESPKKERNEKASYLLRVPSQMEGLVQFIGTEIQKGEKVAPERLIVVQVDGAKRNIRRLRQGDPVKEGQLLVQLDDQFARADVSVKEAKVNASKADSEGAAAIADEAESKLKTAENLYARRAIALEEYRSAKLTRDKMYFDAISKKEAFTLTKAELRVAGEILKQYQIRAPASGTIAAIRKHPGEAVREWETVVEIDVPERKE